MTPAWMLALALAALPVAAAPLAAAAQSPAPAPAPDVIYEVKKGDTLSELAERYLVRLADADEIQRLNRVANPKRLPVGGKLTIPAALLRTGPVIGKLTAYSGPVTVSGEGAKPLAKDMEIREGFVLATGANAFLTLGLPDNSHVTLPSQSRIRIARLRQVLLTGSLQRDFQLEQGRSSAVVTPMTDPQSRFNISTPLAVSAVRGTEFRVGYDAAASHATVEVIEGKVAEAAAVVPSEVAVPAGFGTSATPQGVQPPRALLPRPSLNNAGRLQDDVQVAFQVTPPPGDVSGYRAQVANDAGFIDIVGETTAASPALTLPALPNGIYFARFTVLDGGGLEGIPAAYAFERRLNVVGAEPAAPAPGGKRRFLFKWASTGGAPETFRFTLGPGEDGSKAVVDQAGLTVNQIVVTDIPPGVYYWRVLVQRREAGRLYEKWTAIQRFEIGR